MTQPEQIKCSSCSCRNYHKLWKSQSPRKQGFNLPHPLCRTLSGKCSRMTRKSSKRGQSAWKLTEKLPRQVDRHCTRTSTVAQLDIWRRPSCACTPPPNSQPPGWVRSPSCAGLLSQLLVAGSDVRGQSWNEDKINPSATGDFTPASSTRLNNFISFISSEPEPHTAGCLCLLKWMEEWWRQAMV